MKTAAITAACALTSTPATWALLAGEAKAATSAAGSRIIDIHTHSEPNNSGYIDEFLRVSNPLNLTGCRLTPFENRKTVADAVRPDPAQIIPFGYLDLDAPDVTKQVEKFHALGYRVLDELEFLKKPYTDSHTFPCTSWPTVVEGVRSSGNKNIWFGGNNPSSSSFDPNPILANPRFVNADRGTPDFRLQAASPAIGASNVAVVPAVSSNYDFEFIPLGAPVINRGTY